MNNTLFDHRSVLTHLGTGSTYLGTLEFLSKSDLKSLEEEGEVEEVKPSPPLFQSDMLCVVGALWW